jgi:anaerobic magnesium-protoporphyrin IX monomethyl ester cyclase
MASICLIRPPAVEAFRFSTGSITVPLGLAYIAASIEDAGHDVHVADSISEGPNVRTNYFRGYLVGLRFDEIITRIPDDVEFIGITVIFTHEWPAIVRLVDMIKSARPDLPVILGGEHITSMPEFCLLTSKADFLVLGEGEETVVELLNSFESGAALNNIDGLAFRSNDSITVNPRRSRRTDIDSISWPAWKHFDLEAYHQNRFVGGMYSEHLTVPILATRGCPYQCTYCSAPNMWIPRWIPRDPMLVVDEIEHYVKTFGARNFPFQDLTAIVQKKWIVKFCEELLNRKLDITWQLPTGTRCEPLDADVAALLKKTGMINLPFAPESGSEETRKLIKKKMKTELLFNSIDDAVNAGLNVSIYIVIGFPHDKRAHLESNFPFIDRLAAHGVTDVGVGYYMALPGTEIFNSLYEAGKITLDRAYFRHILDCQSLIPSQSYSDNLTRTSLTRWKVGFLTRFYKARFRQRSRSNRSTSSLPIEGTKSGSAEQGSRFKTALRNGLVSAWETVRVNFEARWLSSDREKAMFEAWDDIFRAVQNKKRDEGAIPTSTNTALLHSDNVITSLSKQHAGMSMSLETNK